MSPAPKPASAPTEVRYSLPELLREVEVERNAPAFAMEKLDQVEIAKLFAKGKTRRALKPRK
jgi:hypothetical protein